MGNIEKEVKIARILISISVIFGLLVVAALFVIGIGGIVGKSGFPGAIRAGALLLATIKATGLGFGFAAYRAIIRGDPWRGGRYALIASFLPPLDLIALFAGLIALSSRRGGGTG
ncbi:MAG: hypothetical protein GX882_03470 [Methanomicrobiales archaeon]|nr:hypothetical protein [Methanomicrobiales archaeon]